MFKNLLRDFPEIKKIDRLWLIVWISIYASFLFLDIFIPDFIGSSVIKYLGIFLCLIYTYHKFRHDYLLILALLFTLLADTVLVWTSYQIAGVFCFCFAQFFHMTRLTKAQPSFFIVYFLSVFLVFIFAITRGIDPIYAVSLIYAASLLTNLWLSHEWHRSEPKNFRSICAHYGFVLFILCDVCVATEHLILDGLLPSLALPIVSVVIWFFYYPSQVLISNSSTISK